MIKILINNQWYEFQVGNITLTKQLYDPTQPLLGQGEFSYSFKIGMDGTHYSQLFGTHRLSSWKDGHEAQLLVDGVTLNGWFVVSKIERDGVTGSFSDRRNFRTILSSKKLTDLIIEDFIFTGFFDDGFTKLPFNPNKASIHSMMLEEDFPIAPAVILSSKLPNGEGFSFDLNIPRWNNDDVWCISSNAKEIYRLNGSLAITSTLLAEDADLDLNYVINRTFRDNKQEWKCPQYYRSNGSTFERVQAARQAFLKDWKDYRLGVRISDIIKSIFTENGYKIDSVLLNDKQFQRMFWFNETSIDDLKCRDLGKVNIETPSIQELNIVQRVYAPIPALQPWIGTKDAYGFNPADFIPDNLIDIYNVDPIFPKTRWYHSNHTSGEYRSTPNSQTGSLNYSMSRAYLSELMDDKPIWTVVTPTIQANNLMVDNALSLNLDSNPNDGVSQLGDNTGGEWIVPFDGKYRVILEFAYEDARIGTAGTFNNDANDVARSRVQNVGIVLYSDVPELDFSTFYDEVQTNSSLITANGVYVYQRLMGDNTIHTPTGINLTPNPRVRFNSNATGVSTNYVQPSPVLTTKNGNPLTDVFGHFYYDYAGLTYLKNEFVVDLKRGERIKFGIFFPARDKRIIEDWLEPTPAIKMLNPIATFNAIPVDTNVTISAGNILKKEVTQLDFLKQFLQVFNHSLQVDEVNKSAVIFDNNLSVSDLNTIDSVDNFNVVEINNTERITLPNFIWEEVDNTTRGVTAFTEQLTKDYQPDAAKVDVTVFSAIPQNGWLKTTDLLNYSSFQIPVPIYSLLEDFNREQNDPELVGSLKPLPGSLLLTRGWSNGFDLIYDSTSIFTPSQKLLVVDGIGDTNNRYYTFQLPLWTPAQVHPDQTVYANLSPYPLEEVNDFNSPVSPFLRNDEATDSILDKFWGSDRLYEFTETVVLTIPYFSGMNFTNITNGSWIRTVNGRFLIIKAEYQTGDRIVKITCLRPR
jgi:hypothetical protein